MECYYIQTNSGQTGPFSLEEMKEKHLQFETPIWKTGMTDWVKAQDLVEIQPYILKTPPAYKQSLGKPNDLLSKKSLETNSKIKKNSSRKILAIALLFIIIASISFLNRKNKINYNTYTPLDNERETPAKYLEATGTYRPIFFSNKWEIDGLIINKASHTNYKDIHIHVNFFSQTKTVLESADYVIYEYVPFGTTQIFKLQVEKPTSAASIGWEATGGKWY